MARRTEITHDSAAVVAEREFKVQINKINPSDLRESEKVSSRLLGVYDRS